MKIVSLWYVFVCYHRFGFLELQWYWKKYAQDSGFLFGNLRQIPSARRGFWKSLGQPAGPSGFSKSPPGFGGSERRFPPKNPNFLYNSLTICAFELKKWICYFFPEKSIIITGYLKRRSHSPWVYILWNICTGSFRGKTLNSWIITLNVL